MKKYFVIISLLAASFTIQAQQFLMPSQVHRNLVYMNPSLAGCYETTVISLMHRTNWIGGFGKREFQNLELHSPFKKRKAVAMGFQINREHIGATESIEAYGNFAYRILMDKSTLAFGLKFGGYTEGIKRNEIFLEGSGTDPTFNAYESIQLPNFGFGLSYYMSNYFIGVSIPYLLANKEGSVHFDYNDFDYILVTGAKIPAWAGSIILEPVGAVYYRTKSVPSVSIVMNANYKNMLYAGVGYRYNEAIIFNFGYYLSNQVSFICSYDFNIGKTGTYSKGSVEAGFLLNWGYKVNTVDPRDF